MQASLRWGAHAAMHTLVEVTELLSAERRGAAADSGDLDVGACASRIVLTSKSHMYLLKSIFIVLKQNPREGRARSVCPDFLRVQL